VQPIFTYVVRVQRGSVNSGAEACLRNLPLMLKVTIRAPGLADPVLLPAAAGIRLV
jgi:hypothetical protein